MDLLRKCYDLMFKLEQGPPYTRYFRHWVSDTTFLLTLGLGIGAPQVQEFHDIRYYPPGHYMDKASAYFPTDGLWFWYWRHVGFVRPDVMEAYRQGFAQAKAILWAAIQEIDRTWVEEPSAEEEAPALEEPSAEGDASAEEESSAEGDASAEGDS